MQVHGGSVYSKAGINTSKSSYIDSSDTTIISYFGSWSDFALISNQKIKSKNAGMASGAALSGGNLSGDTICVHSPLTVANNQCKTNKANVDLGEASIPAINTPEKYFDVFKTIFISRDPELSGVSSDGIRIENGAGGRFEFDDGRTVVYYTTSGKPITIDGDLISEDLSAAGSYSSASEIPQILILSDGDVNIEETVERVDAWIIAKGTVNTCAGYDPHSTDNSLHPNSDDCNSELIINGPVVSNGLTLPRTKGSDPSGGEEDMSTPAELIDYLPSTILWAYSKSRNGNLPQTVYIKTLPPRY